MEELTKDYVLIDRKLLISTMEEKMNISQTIMTQYATSPSWTEQRKFEFYYGQYMAFKEILTMLKNM